MTDMDNIAIEGERRVRSVLGEVLDLLDPREAKVVSRAVRSTGDLDLVGTLRFSKEALTVGPKLIRKGILVDTRMAKVALGNLGIYKEPIVKNNRYMSQDIVEGWASEINGRAVLIGTSPLALEKLLDLIDSGARPGLVIGVPVGLVNAISAKLRLARQSKVEFITNISVKGGVAWELALQEP
ncbi:precorrin-8X methylmutase [Metallosphaera hakonensis]|uniref:precorrin-8X methylmutase n=1 Tax=Metallosphaera hakonensis TaxID=79601 RepID=UPI000B1EF874|nr:precorrin-8X methylmutase [Metallosphaera hakonensis]